MSRRFPCGAALALALGLLLLPSCSRDGGAAPGAAPTGGPPPASVEVFTVTPQSLVDVVDLVGQLESDESVELRSEVDGVIEAVRFDEGQEVKKGAVLFELRDAEQRARLHEAEANAALSEEVYRRTSELAKKNIAAASQLDRARADLDGARARVELAQVELARTQIRAPFDGVVGVRQVSPGDRVTDATKLVQIDAVARLRLAFVVPEIAVPIARVGREVALTTAPYPGETFRGEVFFVAPTLDPATRRLLLKAWVPNPDRRLRPGLFAEMKLTLGERNDALLVPEEALVHDRQGTYVWKIGADGLAARTPVEVGTRKGGRVELETGVAVGDVIVSAGTHKVTQGAPVRAAESAPEEPPTAAGGPAPIGGGR